MPPGIYERPETIVRFNKKWVPSKEYFFNRSRCWEWTASKMPMGYGRLGVNGRMVLAHRWSYENFVGPIPENLVIDHLCRNTSCCNPAHLEAVPQSVNILRGDHSTRRKPYCKRGHLFDSIGSDGRQVCRRCKRDTMRIRRDAERRAA